MKTYLLGALLAGAALGDNVTEWNRIAMGTISTEPAQVQSRLAAITHLAVFEAVNAIMQDYEPYLRTVAASPGASTDAAATVAAHQVLRNYLPARASSLDADRERMLAAIPDGPAKQAGIATGEAAATAMIAQRANDGAGTPIVYTPQSGVGFWQPTPSGFAAATFLHWGRVTPLG